MMIYQAELSDMSRLMIIEEACFPPEQVLEVDDIESYVKRSMCYVLADLSGVSDMQTVVSPARPNGIVAGFILLRVKSGLGRIDGLAVAPEYRKQGVGGRLVESAITDLCYVHDCDCVELECDLHLAQFYMRHGFEVCGYFTEGTKDRRRHRLAMRREKRP